MAFGEKKPLEIPNMGNFILGPETSTNFESGFRYQLSMMTQKKKILCKIMLGNHLPPRGLI